MDYKNIITKNMISATAGFPIAFLMNLMILPSLIEWVEYHWLLGTLALGLPYFVASVVRMSTIDVAWEKYNINIDPTYYLKKLLNKRLNH